MTVSAALMVSVVDGGLLLRGIKRNHKGTSAWRWGREKDVVKITKVTLGLSGLSDGGMKKVEIKRRNKVRGWSNVEGQRGRGWKKREGETQRSVKGRPRVGARGIPSFSWEHCSTPGRIKLYIKKHQALDTRTVLTSSCILYSFLFLSALCMRNGRFPSTTTTTIHQGEMISNK
jgi:hypothetical protein